MSDTYEHNQGDHEDPQPEATWMIGFIGTVLFVVVFFGLVALFYGAQDETTAGKIAEVAAVERANDKPLTAADEIEFREKKTPAASLKRVEQRILDAPPRWISIRSGNAEIERQLVVPIDHAMGLIVEEMKR